MDLLLSLLALTLPVLLGGLWLNLLTPLSVTARTCIVWGNGALIGLLVIPLLMRLLDALEVPLDFLATSSLTTALIVLAGLVHIYTGKSAKFAQGPISSFSNLAPLHRILFVVLGALLIVRITTLGLEILYRPLYPWDATMHWATKARVWFEFNSLVPFVDNATWLNSGGDGHFTDRHSGYPITAPLLQLWMNSAIGRWDESLMNLPWLLCLVAMGTAFYGQLRASGSGPAISMAFTYILLSMPLINIHVALAGYADLFLGASYCAALMAFHNWSITKQRWQGFLALFFALSCVLIKNEGFFWLLTLIPALLLVLMPLRRAAPLLSVTLVAGLGLLILAPGDVSIAGYSLNQLQLNFRPETLISIFKSFWLHDSWHLFGYLLTFVIPLGLIMPRAISHTYLGISAALAAAVGLFLFLFLFTGFAWGALNFTAVGRLSVQLVPGLLFLVALLFNEIYTRGGIRPPQTGSASTPG